MKKDGDGYKKSRISTGIIQDMDRKQSLSRYQWKLSNPWHTLRISCTQYPWGPFKAVVTISSNAFFLDSIVTKFDLEDWHYLARWKSLNSGKDFLKITILHKEQRRNWTFIGNLDKLATRYEFSNTVLLTRKNTFYKRFFQQKFKNYKRAKSWL